MKYYLKQKKFSFKDKFTVKDQAGNDLFQVQGKVISIKNTGKEENISASALQSGVYILVAKGSENKTFAKAIMMPLQLYMASKMLMLNEFSLYWN